VLDREAPGIAEAMREASRPHTANWMLSRADDTPPARRYVRPMASEEPGFVSRGFIGRPHGPGADRLPPGQYLERGFPVLTAGPTPRVEPAEWSFRIDGMVANELEWSWDDFAKLPFEDIPCDIHCVTKWSKLGTSFRGVSVDVLLESARPEGEFSTAYSFGGYTTNLALEELTGGRAWVVTEHEGAPLPREHGGPARLLVPHLYFWKSAKWVRGLRVMDHDEPGFWESNGYNNHGDPWKEERYWTD
jgi:DMSO/TMAO reductase YedYZ molybdopterin-dependent catalytic subunit